MFNENKYTKWYYNIINSRKSNVLDKNTYGETHHILPKSLGGNNKKENLIRLSGREHFVCHILLTKMTTGSAQRKMVFAANMMLVSNKLQGRHVPNSRIYEKLKIEFSKAISEQMTGRKQTIESNLKRRKTLLGTKRIFSDSHRSNMSAAKLGKPNLKRRGVSTTLKGKTYSEIMGENKAKELVKIRSQAWINRKVSDETKQKQSANRKGKRLGGENTNAKSFLFQDILYPTVEDAIQASGLSRYKFNKLYRGFKDKPRKKK